MFDKLVENLYEKLKSDKIYLKVLAVLGLALCALALAFKFKNILSLVELFKVEKLVKEEKTKDRELSNELDALNEKEVIIDKTIAESKEVVKDLIEDRLKDEKIHVEKVSTIDSINSWDDVDKIVKK